MPDYKKRAEMYKKMLDTSKDIIALVDLEGKILKINKPGKMIVMKKFNLTNEDDFKIAGANMKNILNETNFSLFSERAKIVKKTKAAQFFNLENNSRWYEINIHPIFDDNGEVVLFIFSIFDTTEIKQSSEILKNTTERLETAERITHMGYWDINLENKKVYWSSEIYRIFGLNPKKFFHRKNEVFKYASPDEVKTFRKKIINSIRTGSPNEGNACIVRKDGTYRHCYYRIQFINEHGNRRIVGTLQDLTKLINTQIELENAKKIAEKSNQAKSSFLASASHDLRQPMQALTMFIDAMHNEDLTKTQKRILEKIDLSTSSLKSLLDNLLDISRIDTGSVSYNPSIFNMKPLIEQLTLEYKEVAKNKGLIFKSVPRNCYVKSDPVLVERIIRNLISNAIKYTKQGKILLGCKRENNQIRVEVWDTGIGVDNEDAGKIFQEFYQVDNPSRDKSKGVGLGLAIVRRLIQIIGSVIDLKSTLNKGSVFYFYLPINEKVNNTKSNLKIKKTTNSKNKKKIKSKNREKHILIVDDEIEIRKSMRLALSNDKTMIITCRNGQDAIRTLRGIEFKFDMIIADYRLAENETGVQVIDAVRNITQKEIPAVIITADSNEEITQQAERRNCKLILKPASPARVRQLIDDL
jgi:PAS domain S-box-containing protein